MEQAKVLDIAHVSFLDMMRTLIEMSGPAAAKGTLIRNALSTGKKLERVDFATFDDFVQAIDDLQTPIATIEGKATHVGEGLFGLPNCPFAASISNYKAVFGGLPEIYDQVTEEYNKEGRVTDEHRVGTGAGVSPFCAVHQPLRAATGLRITIGGKPIKVYQLGCKSGAGKKGLADKFIEECGVSSDQVSKVLDDHMCCYFVKVMD